MDWVTPLEDRREGKRRICPVCRRANPANVRYCVACWSTLDYANLVSPEAALRIEREARRSRLLRRVLKWSLILGSLLALVLWTAYDMLNISLHSESASTSISSSTAQWSMLGHDSARTGYSPEGIPPEGKLAWQFNTSAPLAAAPAISNGTVYLATGDARIVALGAEKGNIIWEQKLSGPVDSSPAVAGGLVFLGLRDSRIVALDAATGELRWAYHTGNPVVGSPVVQNGILYIGSGDGYLYTLDAATGMPRWRYRTGAWIYSAPAIADGVVAFLSAEDKLYLANLNNGAKRLVFQLPGAAIGGTPVIAGDRVLVGSGISVTSENKGWFRAVDLRAKEITIERWFRWWWLRFWLWSMAPEPPAPKGLIWRFPTHGAPYGAAAVKNDTAFIGDGAGFLYAVDVRSGKGLWEVNLGSAVTASPVVADSTVVVATADGKLRAVSTDGRILDWGFTTKDKITTSPAVAGGYVYAASSDGTLYAIK